jgi:hypothetical protein
MMAKKKALKKRQLFSERELEQLVTNQRKTNNLLKKLLAVEKAKSAAAGAK